MTTVGIEVGLDVGVGVGVGGGAELVPDDDGPLPEVGDADG